MSYTQLQLYDNHIIAIGFLFGDQVNYLCNRLIVNIFSMQFEEFSLSLESLFCILCGDDLYTTFELVYANTDSYAIRFFSNLYLISFIFIFIYARLVYWNL